MTGQLREGNSMKRKRDENHGEGLAGDQGEQAPGEIIFIPSKGVLQECIYIKHIYIYIYIYIYI